PLKTSPYHFYQFWLNISDEDALRYLPVYTLLPMKEIAAIALEHAQAPHKRLAQRRLAEDVTGRVHGAVALGQAQAASDLLFGKVSREQMMALEENVLLQALDGVPVHTVSRSLLSEACDWVQILSDHSGIFSSRSEARTMISGGGVSLNKEKCEDVHAQASEKDLFAGRLVLVQKGKKNYHLLIFSN
ncbi:MAG: S4 domain-containing protein, partial [Bacteroidota bacterium]